MKWEVFEVTWSWLPHIMDVPLVADPGTTYGYSNFSSHLLAVIAARACDTDLLPYAQKYIFSPIGATIGRWTADPYGYRWGHWEIYLMARDLAYGYQWWSARVGDHHFDFAWGHGGQLIILLEALNMIVVTTADPLYYKPAEAGWAYEGAIIDLVGEFISTLPKE